MAARMGENIAREWGEDILSTRVWDALQLIKTDSSKGAESLSRVADDGSPLAMVYLGNFYLNGDYGNEVNIPLGEGWLIKSVNNGSVEGEYCFAHHLKNTDRLEFAIKSYERLCKLKYHPACFNLGYLYATGGKIQKDTNIAIYYFRKASIGWHFPSINWICHILMKEKKGIIYWIMGFTIKVFLTLPYVCVRVCSPNSDRLRT